VPSAPLAAQPAEAEEFTPPAPFTPSTPVRPAPIRRTTSTPMRPAQMGEPTGSRPVPIGSTLSGDETASEPPLPAPVAPPRPAAIAPRGSTPIMTPSAPERRTRYFTVEDFKEVRQTYPREGLPPLPLLSDTELNKPTEQEINNNARIIENTLLEFDIDVEVVDVRVGPTVTQYAVQPFREVTNDQGETVTQRVRVNKISSLGGDLALALAAKRLRIQPYVPGHPYMGIEVPNHTPSVVALRPVMESEVFARAFLKPDPELPNQNREMPLVVPLGRDVSGEAVVVDLATMPHMLIAGTTGSGKSVCITAMITALMMNNLPDRVKLILLDPKMVELSRFNGVPHLLGPVETDIERIIGVLRWATREMDRRYKLLEVEAARNLEVYNRALGKRRKAEHLPYVVILVDEIGDLMLSRPEEMEHTVTRLAQMARAVGMHLVIATQRPSTDVITGLIKANFPARISFAVASGVDSRVILDTTGAESLIGRGDKLYLAPDAGAPRRVQGCFVADSEIEALVNYWKRWQAEKEITGDTPPMEIAPWERGITRRESYSDTDAMLEDAIDLVVREGEASTSLIQRRLGIAYPRAAQLMDLISELGILGATKEDGRTREVTMKPGTDPYKKLIAKYRKLR
jgi:S-DNA-T family DNA segregation ATPase FtsK/SpoIIIE